MRQIGEILKAQFGREFGEITKPQKSYEERLRQMLADDANDRATRARLSGVIEE